MPTTPPFVLEPRSESAGILLAHHWMELFRGGEAVLEQFGLLFPDAPIALMMYRPDHLPEDLLRRKYHTSAVHNSAFLREHFRKLLPFFPEIIRTIKVPEATRFVLSSDASLIKGISLPEGAQHVCYCHSPPRYLWGLSDSYMESSSHENWFGRKLFTAAIPRLQRYDRAKARLVNHFIANSACVQERIKRYYNRDSVVIHPPVNVDRLRHDRPREDFFLVVSALVPYKRVDLAVDACTKLGQKLVVIGTGPEENDLRKRAGSTVTFLGWQSNEVVRDHFERCRAFLFPGIEDFGITPCEAQAAGAPVIAFGEGGALETVKDGVSGLFFLEQTVDALAEAIKGLINRGGFSAQACRDNVAHLGPERFRNEMKAFLSRELPTIFRPEFWSATPAIR